MALVTDPTSADFNALVSLAAANLYHENRLHTASWDGATPTDREKAITFATSVLLLDVTVPATIPARLANACAEYAMHLLVSDRLSDFGAQGIEGVELGPIKIDLEANSPVDRYPQIVKDMIAPYVTRRMGRLVRT